MSPWLALRYALRDLRAGLQGFRIFLLCIILGVASIGMVGTLADAITRGMVEQGQPLLGGDIEISLRQRELDPAARTALDATGRWSSIVTLRAMAAAHERVSLIELKAIDDAYPLFGTLTLAPDVSRADAFSLRNGLYGAAADPLLMARLGVKPGDRIRIGTSEVELRAAIAHEPDRAAQGFVLGPRLMMSREGLDAAGLLQPGSLATFGYRLRLDDPAHLAERAAAIEAKADAQGFEMKTRDKAAPGLTRAVDQLGLFLTLVGLSALIVGGTGIANAVKAFLDRRRLPIAILKGLGASRRFTLWVFLWEVMIVAAGGVLIALIPAALTPFIAAELLGAVLPVPVKAAIAFAPLLAAAAAGLLTAFAFSLWPLARASNTPAAGLFRGIEAAGGRRPGWLTLTIIALALASLALLARSAFGDARLTGWFLIGLTAAFLLLALLGQGLMRLARHVPKPRSAVLRYAIGNLDRPGAATPAITIALGLGLTLFVTLALIDRNVTSALTASLPARAPAFFFLDVPDRAHEDFLRMLKDQSGTGSIESVPMLRGRIIRVKDTPADQVKPKHDGWVLSGDRGLTYADELPAGSRLVAGTWWPKDYQGPPLVSLTADAASGLGLAIGDSITVNVLGREVTAQIANLREVDWRSLGINFVMVFTPVTLKAAPHANLVTVTADPGREDAILAASAAAFPAVTAVSVREVLADVTRLLGKLILAIRGANAVTLATGVLVLTGALAGGLDTRIRDAAVLKTYGATRRQLMTAYIAEFAISGLTTAAFAMLAGGLAAWAVVSRIFELDFTFSPLTALVTALAGMGLTIASGLFVTWRALAMKPAGHLRNG